MRRIIYKDLNASNYKIELGFFTFYFSSELYRDKFNRVYREYLEEENRSLSIKYQGVIYADEMLLLKLYQTIEKRGFLVFYKGMKIKKDFIIDCTLNLELTNLEV